MLCLERVDAMVTAAVARGADVSVADEAREVFLRDLNAPPRALSMDQDELELRIALGVARG